MSGIGHIGEIKTIEYLKKKKGMALYLPFKDVGIDFVATRGNHFYQVQVKTSTFQKNSYFWFDLYKHKMVYSKNTFYIFVCYTLPRRKFMGKSSNYLVIPSLNLKKWIGQGKIAPKQGNKNCFNIFIYPDQDNNSWTYKNKGKQINLTSYWNNFVYFD